MAADAGATMATPTGPTGVSHGAQVLRGAHNLEQPRARTSLDEALTAGAHSGS